MTMMVLGLRQFGYWTWSFPFLEWWKCYFVRIRYHVFRIQVFLLLYKFIDIDIYLIIPRIPNMPKSSIRSILQLVVSLLGTVCSLSLYDVKQYHHVSRWILVPVALLVVSTLWALLLILIMSIWSKPGFREERKKMYMTMIRGWIV